MRPSSQASGVLGDGADDVQSGGTLETFESRRRIDFHHFRAALRLEQIDPGDAERQDVRGTDRRLRIRRWKLHRRSFAAAMQIATEFARTRLAPHRSDDAVADDESTDVAPA